MKMLKSRKLLAAAVPLAFAACGHAQPPAPRVASVPAPVVEAAAAPEPVPAPAAAPVEVTLLSTTPAPAPAATAAPMVDGDGRPLAGNCRSKRDGACSVVER